MYSIRYSLSELGSEIQPRLSGDSKFTILFRQTEYQDSLPGLLESGASCFITDIIRSYPAETVASRPICETKRQWANSVLRWGTTRESLVVNVLSIIFSSTSMWESNPLNISGFLKAGIEPAKYFVREANPLTYFAGGNRTH